MVKTKHIHIRIPEDIHWKVKQKVAKEKSSVTKVVMDFIEKWLKK